MAIFKQTIAVIDKTLKVENKASTAVDKIGTLLDKIFAFILKIVGLLRTAIKALDTIEAFIQKTAKAIRTNPLAKGLWKIIFTIAAGILGGVAAVIAGISAILKSLQKAAKSSVMKKIEDAMLKVVLILGTYGTISATIKRKLQLLRKLCVVLETQQEAIEKANPNLRNSVQKNILTPVSKWVDELDKLIDKITKGTTKLETAMAKLKALEALLNGLDKLANALRNVIRNFFDRVLQLFDLIKALIFSIPFIGWLLDKLDEFIEWAIKASGLKKALNASAECKIPPKKL